MNRGIKNVILCVVVLAIANIFIFQIIITMKNDKKKNDKIINNSYNEAITQAYKINPSILNFDENNEAILSIEKLLYGVSNGTENFSFGNITHNEKHDACVGYFIVTKNQDATLSVDNTHICDMVDY